MHRFMTSVLVGLAVLVFAGQALASQCPKLIGQINAATATRYDATAADAKAQAAQADALHKAGNHAESEKIAKAALEKLK